MVSSNRSGRLLVSCMVHMNEAGYTDVLAVDDFSGQTKTGTRNKTMGAGGRIIFTAGWSLSTVGC